MYIHNELNELSLVAQLVERQTRTLESVCVLNCVQGSSVYCLL